MTDKMLKFVKIGQQTPPKRETATRKEDFNEIYDEFVKKKAEELIGKNSEIPCIAERISISIKS